MSSPSPTACTPARAANPRLRSRQTGPTRKSSVTTTTTPWRSRWWTPKPIEYTRKLSGKVIGTSSVTVSADGSTLSGKFTDYTGTKPATGSYTEKRVGAAPAGAHAAHGLVATGKDDRGQRRPDHDQLQDDGRFLQHHSNGQSYNAKFDGKEYPVEGDPGHTMVTLKRVAPMPCSRPTDARARSPTKFVWWRRRTVRRSSSPIRM